MRAQKLKVVQVVNDCFKKKISAIYFIVGTQNMSAL